MAAKMIVKNVSDPPATLVFEGERARVALRPGESIPVTIYEGHIKVSELAPDDTNVIQFHNEQTA